MKPLFCYSSRNFAIFSFLTSLNWKNDTIDTVTVSISVLIAFTNKLLSIYTIEPFIFCSAHTLTEVAIKALSECITSTPQYLFCPYQQKVSSDSSTKYILPTHMSSGCVTGRMSTRHLGQRRETFKPRDFKAFSNRKP